MAPQDPNASTENNGVGLFATATVMLAISWISVALRTYVRAVMTRSFQADDWVMLAGLAVFTVSCVFIYLGLGFGLGSHNRALSQADEIEALKWQALATGSYVLDMWLIKLSIGMFLLRLAVQKRYKYVLHLSIFVVGVWSLALFFWNVFQCNPVSAQWDYTVLERDPTSHCVTADEIVSAAYSLSALTILSDWFYALIPIPMIWSVTMTTQAKWSVIAVLGLGIFASVATLIRLKFLADLTDVSDILHAGTDAMIWTLIEPGVAISAASLATIRPLLRSWRIGGFTDSERSHGTGLNGQDNTKNQGSRGGRANSKVPGFDSGDVTLLDIEQGEVDGGKRESELGGNFGRDEGDDTKTAPQHRVVPITRVVEACPSPELVQYGTRWEGDQDDYEDTTRKRRNEVYSQTFGVEYTPPSYSYPYSHSETHSDQHLHPHPRADAAWLDQESDDSIELHRPRQTSVLSIPSSITPRR
ncbi:hypothetical protein GGS20DRAFT_398939 [Poronia punctata]|nr:hypothetical protein GGS20DRAFT_398939 [Poronia punctata]